MYKDLKKFITKEGYLAIIRLISWGNINGYIQTFSTPDRGGYIIKTDEFGDTLWTKTFYEDYPFKTRDKYGHTSGRSEHLFLRFRLY